MKLAQLLPYCFIGVAVLLGSWYYFGNGQIIIASRYTGDQVDKMVSSLLVIAVIIVIWKIAMTVVKASVLKGQGTEGEVVMISSMVKFTIGLVFIIIIAATWTSIGALGTLFVAFGGMLLGWSLQAPISGMAAWLLILIVRPFRVGDRVQLPAQALVGDVVSISPLYTTLNQVGGSVGSEEPANRTILIPNAMLFSALIINYTPKNQEELKKFSQHNNSESKDKNHSSYMLDEFVLRLSFDSDWDEAEKILLNVAREVTADIIKKTGQQPYLRADFGDWYAVFIRLRFMTNATERPKIIYEISKRIFKEIQKNPKVDLGIPYIYSYRKGNQWAPPMSIEKLDNDTQNHSKPVP